MHLLFTFHWLFFSLHLAFWVMSFFNFTLYISVSEGEQVTHVFLKDILYYNFDNICVKQVSLS
jgi:hypothetical protein